MYTKGSEMVRCPTTVLCVLLLLLFVWLLNAFRRAKRRGVWRRLEQVTPQRGGAAAEGSCMDQSAAAAAAGCPTTAAWRSQYTGSRGVLVVTAPLWGWGNTWQHYSEALLLALVLDRTPVIDWSSKKWRGLLPDAFFSLQRCRASYPREATEAREINSSALSDLEGLMELPATVALKLPRVRSFGFPATPAHRRDLTAVQSRHRRCAPAAQLLLREGVAAVRCVAPFFLQAGKDVARAVQGSLGASAGQCGAAPAGGVLALQLRVGSGISWREPQWGVASRHRDAAVMAEHAHACAVQQGYGGQEWRWFVATDSDALRQRLQALRPALADWFAVAAADAAVITSGSTFGVTARCSYSRSRTFWALGGDHQRGAGRFRCAEHFTQADCPAAWSPGG
eukprot:TRINITY_DN40534_c0_g1_i2.p1 TRINITY_DN40534_c0_g1~~TRINITY_DN40534_c0_g1_i2.p1  ORF type:complete len:395 (+),score=52.29 TRINITY_DN40534_c0_g1_i2:37-1221(+)